MINRLYNIFYMALRPWQTKGLAAAGCVVAGVLIAENVSPPPPAFETTLSREVADAMQSGHALNSGQILLMRLVKPDQSILMANLQVGWTRMGSTNLQPPSQEANAAMWCGTDVESGGASSKAEIAYLGAMAAEHGNSSGPPAPDQFKKASDICMAQVLHRMEIGHTLVVPVGTN